MLHPADDGQQARNSCTGLRIFSLGSHTVFVHVHVHLYTHMYNVCIYMYTYSEVFLGFRGQANVVQHKWNTEVVGQGDVPYKWLKRRPTHSEHRL